MVWGDFVVLGSIGFALYLASVRGLIWELLDYLALVVNILVVGALYSSFAESVPDWGLKWVIFLSYLVFYAVLQSLLLQLDMSAREHELVPPDVDKKSAMVIALPKAWIFACLVLGYMNYADMVPKHDQKGFQEGYLTQAARNYSGLAQAFLSLGMSEENAKAYFQEAYENDY